jgi:hypothetical protein
VCFERLDDRDRHRGVVGPHPLLAERRLMVIEREPARDGAGMEQLLAECIADREAFESEPCALAFIHSVIVTL